MGRVIITIAGPWSKPPAIKTRLDVEFGPADPTFADDFIALGERAGVVDAAISRAARAHRMVLTAGAEFDAPGELEWAWTAAQALSDAFERGAVGAIIETADKPIPPRALERLERDASSLLQLFIEITGDAAFITADGLQAFDLPDVAVRYETQSREAAEGAAFGMAAQMVLEGLRPVEGGTFQASESAQKYTTHFEPAASVDDPYVNARGRWVLSCPQVMTRKSQFR